MTGSLATKNGKYYVVLNLYVNGKRKKKWIGTNLPEKGNRRRAEQILREKIMEYEKKEGLIYSDTSFSDYIRFWLDMTSRKVDAITMQGYQILANTHIRFHKLLHSCASVLIAMGWSLKDVQEWLGHSDIKMTANIYSHLDTTRKFSIAQSLSGTFE